MNAQNKNISVMIVFASLLLSGFVWIPITAEGEDSGGTDSNIWIDAGAGGTGGADDWRDAHGFVIIDNDVKRDDEFDVVICEDVKYDSTEEKYKASGHIFGEMSGIVWDDDPEPTITISMEDFDAYKYDAVNLTVYVLGEYLNQDGPGPDEVRQAYKELLVQRPNHAPKAKAQITNSDENENGMWDNWTDVETNDHGEVVYYIDSESSYVKFYFNASISTDQDGDEITVVNWDLDGDSAFGKESNERKMNTTVFLGEGDHNLGLIVGDGNKLSSVLDIHIIVKLPIKYPDLTVQDIQVVNKNGEGNIEPGDRAAIMAHVKNIGDIETNADSSFDVLFEYWFRDESPDEPIWIELGIENVDETIEVNQLKLVEFPWDISNDFTPGVYSFRATVDYSQEIKELREQNNMFPPEGEDMSAENFTVEEGEYLGDPIINIVSVTQSNGLEIVNVNELVYLNVTLKNTGDGDARYVDIYYYVDNSFQYYQTIDNLPADQTEVTTSFAFSGDTNNTSGFKVKFEVRDDGLVIDTTDTLTIRVQGGSGGGTIPDDPEPPKDESGGIDENLPLIIVAVVVIGGLGAAGFVFMRKKDEDVW